MQSGVNLGHGALWLTRANFFIIGSINQILEQLATQMKSNIN
jgi:hypothetical protein